MNIQEPNIVRYYIIFSGRVQGVGFRWHVSTMASEMKLTGTVKNRDDGKVESYIQGPKAKILELIGKLRSLGPYVRVDDYQIKEVPIKEETGFNIIY